MEINQEVLDNAVEFYDNMNVENIAPYMPANGTEGDIFESRWCCNCAKDIGDDCNILTKAFCGEQPTEWIYFNNKPICTAFEKLILVEM
jgi:hypothetical protein